VGGARSRYGRDFFFFHQLADLSQQIVRELLAQRLSRILARFPILNPALVHPRREHQQVH
jgi:hypothetical protein